MKCTFKVAIVGCGSVGATAAYAMLLDGTPTDMALIDLDAERARGLMTDLEHTQSFTNATQLTSGNDMALCQGSNIVFVTAGARQKEGQTRLELIDVNRKIFKSIIPQIAEAAPNAVMVIVSNPVDVLTYDAIKLAKFPKGRVFGTGTMLDTIRFQFHIGEKWKVNPRSVEAFILGEHGDTSFPVLSSAQIAGKNVDTFKGFNKKDVEKAYETTRDAAYRIIHDLGYTCYSIGIVMREIMKHIHSNSRVVIPLSTKLTGEYGYKNSCLSIPCVIGKNGVERTIEIPLNRDEKKALANSVKQLAQWL